MIRRDKGTYVAICDNCEECLDDGYATFTEAKDAARNNGWVIVRDPSTNEWCNLCPSCK